MPVTNDFVISPKELRDTDLREQFRGYDKDEVLELFERAARTLEWLAARARGRSTPPPGDRISPRELVDGDLREVMRGYHKDVVNDLADRAAATIELLQSRIDGSVGAGHDDPVVVTAPAPTRPALVPSPPADEPVTAEIATITSEAPIVAEPPEAAAPVVDAPANEPEVEPGRSVVVVAIAERPYEVHIGSGAHHHLGSVLAGRRRVAVVSQAEVLRHHGEAFASLLDGIAIDSEWFTIDDGEGAKSLATIAELSEQLATNGILRGDVVVAFGGGVVGDVAGFLAATYHRGIDVVQVPTTLLAMVDSAIGGKTGVNLPQGKNLVGAFHQPLAVLADPSTLFTLPVREYHCGLGEVAKYALMGDDVLADLLTRQRGPILVRNPEILTEVIRRSAATKAGFVARDEFERTGVRAHLNYGHTLAHAIETVAEPALAHGEAVAVGLVFAGALAGALERIDSNAVERHRSIVESLGLPGRAPEGLTRDALIAVMRRDKKAAGGLTFVLQGPHGLERVDDPPESALRAAFAAVGIDEPKRSPSSGTEPAR